MTPAPRDIAVVKAAAERAGWEPRPSPRPDRNGDTLTGRGIAYAHRSGAVVAIVAEVDRRSGKVWARKFAVVHDCGLIINPDGLRRCIEGNIVQGTSRALSEEVAFGRAKVTSTDWLLDITEAPEAIDIVLLNRPELPLPAPAKARSARSPPPLPTPSSTHQACASAALR